MELPRPPQNQGPTMHAGWLEEMREHYYATGFIRVEDLKEILGDQTTPVQMRCEVEETGSNTLRPLFD
jgi:hypothetical protein